MLLKFLGRGCAFNLKEGSNSAYFIKDNNLFLLDCGGSAFHGVLDRKLLDGVDSVNVIITHTHSDHVASLSDLIYYCYFIKHIEINVYFPIESIVTLLELEGHIEGKEYNFKKLDVQCNNLLKSINVVPIEVPHYPTLRSFGYLLYIDDKLVWFSGDSNEVSNVRLEYEIDEFYQDTCMADFEGNPHTCITKLENAFPLENRSRVFCMHIDGAELEHKAKSLGFNVVTID